MSGRQSAYSALGLRPGADRAQIDDAYRRLIKLYHPDRPGGDGSRAAEINRAYRELRDAPLNTLPVRPRPVFAAERPPARRRLRGILIGVVGVGAMLFLASYSGQFSPTHSRFVRILPSNPDHRIDDRANPLTPLDTFAQPLSNIIVDGSVADALRLYRSGNSQSLANYSRVCQAHLRSHPDVGWFDSCAAYDEAVVLLENRDAMTDPGPFNPAAVTSREMSAAGLLSDDSLAADSRLHQIRSRVELVLVSKLP